jgi:hypothetical protein
VTAYENIDKLNGRDNHVNPEAQQINGVRKLKWFIEYSVS